MRFTTRQRASGLTLLWGLLLGLAILGIGGRVAMWIIAQKTTGTSSFTLGGTATVLFLGLLSGGLGALILLVARHFFWRWRRATTVLFWLALALLTWRGLGPVDNLRLTTFLPVVALFGGLLQAATFRYRPQGPGTA
jgi:hypothetical protein